jgi:bifunctional pyridoxal-dependent enzyme with beta-cystathionase and maltose regulon repressor activities
MEKIKVSKYALEKLDSLTNILIEKGYFEIEENAIMYVRKIFSFIYAISDKPKLNCKNPIFGKFYRKLKMNRKTTYYITFDQEDENYLI